MNRIVLLFLLWLSAVPAHAITDDDLLEPDAAFAFSAAVADEDRLIARWDIADGYYMYRTRFQFRSETPGVQVGEPDFPPGKVKQDEFFGEIETYRGQLEIALPLARNAASPDHIELIATSQGCADVGVCYPPHEQSVRLSLPALIPAAAAAEPAAGTLPAPPEASPLGALTALGQDLAGGGEEFLDPEEAFRFSARATDGDTVSALWQIADDYYLYKDKLKFRILEPAGVTVGTPDLPAGDFKDDEFFGRTEVYHNGVEAQVPVAREPGGELPVRLAVEYQGCAEAGLCYPPQTQVVALTLPPLTAASATPIAPPAAAAPAADAPFVSEQDRMAGVLAGGQTWLILLTFFGAGLALAFTPCVFPMIPILSSIIIGQGRTLTAWQGFTLSLVYVLAMAVTYTVAGIVAGLAGENLQAAFQNPFVLVSFSLVFVLLALSMFGFYDLQLPSSLQSKLTELSNRQRSGSYIGVAIMGLLSALIVGPCVAPPLMGALIYIGQTGDPLLGGTALFVLSLGMGVPLLAIGASAGKLLPKAGHWMDTVKAVFGVLLLAVAIWMLERIVPAEVTMLLWAALLIVSAIYMGALEPVHRGGPPGEHHAGWQRLWKGVGVLLLMYGALLLIGVAAGGKDWLQPLRGVALVGAGGSEAVAAHGLEFERIKTVADLEARVAAASEEGRGVMLDFYADWCISCKEMEKYTFTDPRVQQALADTVLLQADVTANDAADKALLRHFDLIGPPAILFFSEDRQERRPYRVVGFMPADDFAGRVAMALP